MSQMQPEQKGTDEFEDLGRSLGLLSKMADSDIGRSLAVGAAVLAGGALGTVALVESVAVQQYSDLPMPFTKGTEQGRAKNSLAAIVAGEVGRELYGDADIKLQVEKSFWPDAELTGTTTADSVDTLTEVAFTSAHYTSSGGEGQVAKSEIDWGVTQTAPGHWQISRWGPKFDSELVLEMADGRITGTFVRTGPHIDWSIEGTYDDAGNVEISIDAPLTMGITLKGTITPTGK